MEESNCGGGKRRITIVKIALSLFLLYHLFTIFLMPISSSMAGRKLNRYFTTYANTLGFHTTWQFFSPGPSPMFFLEYSVELADGSELNGGEPIVYPPPRQSLSLDEGWSRRLFGMRFFALAPDRLERFFVPYLCRQSPGAQAISVQSVMVKIEDIERAGTYVELNDNAERVQLPRQRFECPGAHILGSGPDGLNEVPEASPQEVREKEQEVPQGEAQ